MIRVGVWAFLCYLPATVSGWGTLSFEGSQPDQLMEVTVQTVSNTACNTAYGGSITDQMICAAKLGKDACQGDSGGNITTQDLHMKHITL